MADIYNMPLQELSRVRDNLVREIEENQTRFKDMTDAMNRYKHSLNSIDMIERSKKGQALLVPMSNSLFVPGKLASTENVTVEIGTGFFVKRNLTDGRSYINRRLTTLESVLDRVGEGLLALENNRQQVEAVLRKRIELVKQQQDKEQ